MALCFPTYSNKVGSSQNRSGIESESLRFATYGFEPITLTPTREVSRRGWVERFAPPTGAIRSTHWSDSLQCQEALENLIRLAKPEKSIFLVFQHVFQSRESKTDSCRPVWHGVCVSFWHVGRFPHRTSCVGSVLLRPWRWSPRAGSSLTFP